MAALITAGVAVNSSLLLEPAHQLTFWLETSEASDEASTCPPPPRATLRITNLSSTRDAVFKVRTNRAEMFTVKPVHGVVPPGEAREIVVSLVPAAAALLAAEDPRALATRDSERFLIQSLERADDMRGFDVEDLAAFWRRVPRELPAASRIGCRFAVLPSGPVDPRIVATARRMDTIDRPYETKRAAEQSDDEDTGDSFVASEENAEPAPARRPPSPRGIDRTIDLRDAGKAKGGAAQSEPDAFEELENNASGSAAAARRMFEIHPGDTLEFAIRPARPGRPAVLAPAAFFLSNRSRAHALAFKVKTTNHDGYFVKPSRGLIAPSNAQRVEVQPVKDDKASVNTTLDLQQREANDRFLVEIVRVDIATYQELLSLDDRTRKRELVALWDRAGAAAREKAMMSCRIVGDVPAPPLLQRLESLETPPALAARDFSVDDDEHDDAWC